MNKNEKPIIGITCGDLNGVGLEIIIKTFSDNRMLDLCTPIVFASNKVINFYRKSVPELNFNFQSLKDLSRPNTKQTNVFNCWEEDVALSPGLLDMQIGKYAVQSFTQAVDALKKNIVHGIVTSPIHKKTTQSEQFNFTGHTPYLKHAFKADEVVMMLYADNFRVALVTEHLPLKDVASQITKQLILKKLNILNQSLKRDFGIDKPRIAVLGLNPHAGDEGLLGDEEVKIIQPAIVEAKAANIIAVGPYSADAFFARKHFNAFDAILAMYHDQGLIPFKTIAAGEGVNYTVGISGVRTSPDHGVAFDIAGKNQADETSFRKAIFECIEIINQRITFDDNNKNPLKKTAQETLGNTVDETIEED